MVYADVQRESTPPLYLCSWRHPDREVRIVVSGWLWTERIENQFIRHPRSARLVWNYIRRVGVGNAFRKIRSRQAEVLRNHKAFGVALGWVTEAPSQLQHLVDTPVIFLATNHSPDSDSLVVNIDCILSIQPEDSPETQHSPTSLALCAEQLRQYKAWSPYSGVGLDRRIVMQSLAQVVQHALPLPKSPELLAGCTDHLEKQAPESDKPSAVLFGLGNYSKTVIIPNIDALQLKRIHEIDPDQIASFGLRTRAALDTSPVPRDDAAYDAWFIAGFHHTHTELAIEALRRGAYAVVEKPLSTSNAQYKEFYSEVNEGLTPKFFLCFHKRYSPLNQYIWSDMQVDLGTPIDMHCSIYEIPLPQYHWYNWPNSGGRLTSNGCHWLDYFLYLNNFSAVTDVRRWRPRGRDEIVNVSLQNGAYLAMSLTDSGSPRIGVREIIELRSGNASIRIIDSSSYTAEIGHKIVRRTRVNPMDGHARMYQHISRVIVNGGSGDEMASLDSTLLTLTLEDLA